MDYQAGKMIANKDSKGGSDSKNCSYNGCCLKKGAQADWRLRLYNDNPIILMRYADVLLMYAEAKIELNQIDDEVLACINDVRARAYKVKRSETSAYPAITVTDQAALRRIVRRERRVELAWEFDEEGIPNFDKMAAENDYIEQHVERNFVSKVYLWPLPSDEVQIMNGKLEQNPGY